MRLLTITFGNELFLESLSFYFICGFPMSLKRLSFLIFSFEMVPLLQTVIESLVLEEIPCNQRSLCSSLNLSQCWPGTGISHNPFTQQGFQAATPGLWTAPSLPILLLYALQYSLSRTNPLSLQGFPSIPEQHKPALLSLLFFKPHSSPQCSISRTDTVLYTINDLGHWKTITILV